MRVVVQGVNHPEAPEIRTIPTHTHIHTRTLLPQRATLSRGLSPLTTFFGRLPISGAADDECHVINAMAVFAVPFVSVRVFLCVCVSVRDLQNALCRIGFRGIFVCAQEFSWNFADCIMFGVFLCN